jgi:hypothetical protein
MATPPHDCVPRDAERVARWSLGRVWIIIIIHPSIAFAGKSPTLGPIDHRTNEQTAKLAWKYACFLGLCSS